MVIFIENTIPKLNTKTEEGLNSQSKKKPHRQRKIYWRSKSVTPENKQTRSEEATCD